MVRKQILGVAGYMTCSKLRITSITTMTMMICTPLPTLGNLDEMRGPKKPNNHSTNKTIMIIHNMRNLLWNAERMVADPPH